MTKNIFNYSTLYSDTQKYSLQPQSFRTNHQSYPSLSSSPSFVGHLRPSPVLLKVVLLVAASGWTTHSSPYLHANNGPDRVCCVYHNRGSSCRWCPLKCWHPCNLSSQKLKISKYFFPSKGTIPTTSYSRIFPMWEIHLSICKTKERRRFPRSIASWRFLNNLADSCWHFFRIVWWKRTKGDQNYFHLF